MSERRLLVLCYFYPPLGGGGVHRVLGFTRYLPRFGWTCTVVCAGEDDYWVRDDSLLARVPPETRVVTPLKHCPHLLEGQTLCLWRQGSTRQTSRWDPAKFTAIFAVQAAWRWLACYEVWIASGQWPLPEAK